MSVSGKGELNSIKKITKTETKTFHYQKDNTSGNHVAGELVPNLYGFLLLITEDDKNVENQTV